MNIEKLKMRMIDDEASVQFVEAHRPFILKKDDIIDVVGVYDSNVILTDWRADMVIKVFAPKVGLNGEEVYANHRDFAFLGESNFENLKMRMLKENAQVQFIDKDHPFILRKDEITEISGGYLSSICLTEWYADMVIKVFAPAAQLEGQELYAKFSDFRIIWETQASASREAGKGK